MPPLRSDASAQEQLARLQQEHEALRERLEEAEATVEAIRAGHVDAFVVQRHDAPRIFTLVAAEKFYLQLAQDIAHVGTWDIEFATNRVHLSEGLQQLLGIPRQEAVHLDDICLRIANEDRDRVRSELESLRTSEAGELAQEFRVNRPDGSHAWMASQGSVVFGPARERLRLVGISLDITDRKASEAALLESERQFRELADSMPQIVWTAGPDGTVEYFNRRWYECTAYEEGSPTDQQWAEVLHPDDRGRAIAAWGNAIRSGELYQIEYRIRDARHGQYRWHLGRAVPVRNDHGEILRWFGTATDIHDQKQLQESLREADHRKDQFLAMLAHELRNPLSPLTIAADLIAAETDLPEHVRSMAEVLTRQTMQLKRLIDDLLDVSRISTGRLELKRQRVNIRDAVDAALDVSRPLIESSRHTLEVSLEPAPIFIHGDQVRMAQIVGNLLINAAKYTPASGRIGLTVARDGDSAVISVTDNGIGIPQDMLSHIFEMFTQVDSSNTRSQSGLGIGLTLVKTLVEMHDGEVTASSAGAGRGSTFRVILPALAEPLGEGTMAQPTAAAKAALRRRVLIIDDNRSASFLLGKLLAKLHQDVRVAHTAAEAIGCLHEYQPDVVISDIAMPEVSGHELARRIRSLELPKRPILVALTGYGQEDDRRASLAAGFDLHITKPIDLATLQSLMQSVEP